MLRKPQWLADWLSRLNWDVFTWHIYVGDAIEEAIDWVLGGINSVVTWAIAVGAWWEDFRQEVIDLFNLVTSRFGEVWAYLWGLADTLLAQVELWWEAARVEVLGWIDTAIGRVADALVVVTETLAWLVGSWTDFVQQTLPNLLSRFELEDILRAVLEPWRDLFDWWGSFRREVLEFFADPVEFVWQRFADWFLGPEV